MNEREIAAGFSAVWSEYFPMLSPSFIIAFNQAFVRPILGGDGIIQAVASNIKSSRSDVLAEFGFRLASAAYQSRTSVRITATDKAMADAANSVAAKRIQEFRPRRPLDELRLSIQEQQEGIQLAAVYEEFLRLWPTETVTFSPAVRGNGIVNSCIADLAVGETLFEVKTVSRPFQSRDLRQLLLYLALESAAGKPRWEYGGLLNPRLGIFCTFSVDWLVARLSGGRSPKVVFLDFLQALTRDFVHDRHF